MSENQVPETSPENPTPAMGEEIATENLSTEATASSQTESAKDSSSNVEDLPEHTETDTPVDSTDASIESSPPAIAEERPSDVEESDSPASTAADGNVQAIVEENPPTPEAASSETATAEGDATGEPVVGIENSMSEEEKQAREEKKAAEKAERERKKQEEAALRQAEKEAKDAVYAEIVEAKNRGDVITVNVLETVKGGLRVAYKELRIFLPTSHFSLRRFVGSSDLESAVGQDLQVNIIEAQQDNQGRPTVVVSRKKILENEFYSSINVNDVVTGTVSSIAGFGVFVDINGVEGLIHISRLSQSHVQDASEVVKKGDSIEVKVIGIDRDAGRLSLSRKEFEPSPWQDVEQQYPAGSRVNGTVKRFADFGAYVELPSGIEGLLRNSELSWGRRIAHPSEILSVGQQVDLVVISASAEKRRVALGLKQTQDNPWQNIAEQYPLGSEIQVSLTQNTVKGLVVKINEFIEGFMPRGRMGSFVKKVNSLVPGDIIEAVPLEVDGSTQTFILVPKNTDFTEGDYERDNSRKSSSDGGGHRRGGRRDDREKANISPEHQAQQSVSLMDMLSEEERQKLRT